MKYYIQAIKNYANFSGRARRKEYWMFFLFNTIFAIAAMILDKILGLSFTSIGLPYGYIYLAYFLFTLIPSLAVLVRRLHDVGKSGWFFLIGIIPLVNIWLLVVLCTAGDMGTNEYGMNPKQDTPFPDFPSLNA